MVNRNNISLEQSNVPNAENEENYFGDSSSVCSDEASNYPEEQEFESEVKISLEQRRKNAHKRNQVARRNNFWKKKGETKVDKKMRILQHLIPNCPKVDNDSVLDEAIVYIKNLQNQLQFIWSANALATEMYTWRFQTLSQPNIMQHLYESSSSLPSLLGSRIQIPAPEMFIQHPSQTLNSLSSASLSTYESLMAFPPT